MFSFLKESLLVIKGVPAFLKELLFCIFNKLNKFYKNPFVNNTIYEKNYISKLFFSNIIFIKNNFKKFNNIKQKKIGRLKRKIKKRIILSNNLIDF